MCHHGLWVYHCFCVRDTCLSSWRNSLLLLDAKSFIRNKMSSSLNATEIFMLYLLDSAKVMKTPCSVLKVGLPCNCRVILTDHIVWDADWIWLSTAVFRISTLTSMSLVSFLFPLLSLFCFWYKVCTRVVLSVYYLSRKSLYYFLCGKI